MPLQLQLRTTCFCGIAASLMTAAAPSAVSPAASAALASAATLPSFSPDTAFLAPPRHWALGEITSVAVDRHDNVWILHRPYTLSDADRPRAAPPILAFDRQGRFLRAFGGPAAGYEWPATEHTLEVDAQDRVWIGGIFRKDPAKGDDMLLVFAADGRFLRQIGRRGASAGNADTANVRAPADIHVDDRRREVYIADGYANNRVIVFDSESGAFKRMWGAFGNPPVDGPPPSAAELAQPDGPARFDNVHGVEVSRDGLVYVSDRNNKRIQVFTRAGRFVRQVFVHRETAARQTSAGLALSRDPGQRYLYAADWGNAQLLVFDRRSMALLGMLATEGSRPGQVNGPHLIATDSEGSLYVAEVLGRRLQKFTHRR